MPGYTPNVTSTGPEINAKNTGATKVFTSENGTQKFVPTSYHLETTAYTSGGLNTAPVISIGTNAPNYNNIATTTDLLSILGSILSGTGLVSGKSLISSNAVPSLSPNTDVYVNVSAASGSTAYKFRVDIQGYYV